MALRTTHQAFNIGLQPGLDTRASTETTDTIITLLTSPCVPSIPLSPRQVAATAGSKDTMEGPSSPLIPSLPPVVPPKDNKRIDYDSWHRASEYSSKTDVTTTPNCGDQKHKHSNSSNHNSNNTFRPLTRPYSRPRGTGILLNLESSLNDTLFQEILHNKIALDHFRQFCFQEYSIENLLFWMDVELFAKPSLELLEMDRKRRRIDEQQKQLLQRENRGVQGADIALKEDNPCTVDENNENNNGDDDSEGWQAEAGHFAVQHARYIYLTYIDSCGPLQVNLSDESRSDIPWPILDYQPSQSYDINKSAKGHKTKHHVKDESDDVEENEVIGWPVDRHMFDSAQEHTYQLMKGHTLVRFEESALWKMVEKIKREQPDVYAKASIPGPLNSCYRPDPSVILSTVSRSKSRRPTANPATLYNWNNSTSDLDRWRDKEEALALTMSQYFGPIPASILRPGTVILGLGRDEDGDLENELDDFDVCEELAHGHGHVPSVGYGSSGCRSSFSKSLGAKRSRFAKRLGGHRPNRRSKDLWNADDESTDIYNNDATTGIDAIENGRRTTRWMVAGYFNDQYRLTAAQRKRLLRRNNKLTKFFGTRVDGALRPAEFSEDAQKTIISESASAFTFDQHGRGPSGADLASLFSGPPPHLTYALSSSTIHDMSKGKAKKSIGRKSKHTMAKRNALETNGASRSEVLLLLPGAGGHKATNRGNIRTNRSKSAAILQMFKKATSDLGEDIKTNGYRSFNSSSLSHDSMDTQRSPVSSKYSKVSSRKPSSNEDGGIGRFSSATAPETLQCRRIFAHPHPLWSGSLSDQEGFGSTTPGYRRGLSILSIGTNNNNVSGNGSSSKSPTSPTSTLNMTASFSQFQDRIIDRQSMTTRRKKADKLSMFFGAQLTTHELSSQLPMDHTEFGLDNTIFNDNQHSEERKVENKVRYRRPRATGPAYSSVNQLSHRQRTILWKRNKKLRGLLGETLPESEVALALTRPVLDVSEYGVYSNRDETQDEKEKLELSEGADGVNRKAGEIVRIRSNRAKSQSRIVRRTYSTRTHHPSVVSVSSKRSQIRMTRANALDLARAYSNYSLNSLQPKDMTHTSSFQYEDDIGAHGDDGYYELTLPHSSTPSRRKQSIVSSEASDYTDSGSYLCIDVKMEATDIGRSRSLDSMSHFHHKKKMDKIQQFLGDRVPEQDLWMGTFGRERAREMMDMNLLSPARSTGSGSSHLLNKHELSPKDKNKYGNASTELKGTMRSTTTAAAVAMAVAAGPVPEVVAGKGTIRKRSAATTIMTTLPGDLKLERSLSDTPTHSFGRLKQDVPSGDLSQQHQLPPQPQSWLSKITNDASMDSTIATPLQDSCVNPSSDKSLSTLNLGNNHDTNKYRHNEDEPTQILPRLRAMSDKDQERFLRRAQKLEKLFGHFPPSALLLEGASAMAGDLASPSSSLVNMSAGSGFNTEVTDGNSSNNNPFPSLPPLRQRGLAKLAGLLNHSDGNTNANNNADYEYYHGSLSFPPRSSSRQKKENGKGKDAKDELSFFTKTTPLHRISSGRSSENMMKSLIVTETPFHVEI
ncbi:hypothetical protein BX616_000799 [Lobosporangium transversale]|nr:hypothetical protein BX616_000799 [Lobosporangium transversale]